MWQELTRGNVLLTAAALFLSLGIFLWRVNSALRNSFRHQQTYADNLRRAGRGPDADRVEEATRRVAQRVPVYGKILVVAGLVLGILGLIRLR